MNINDWYLSKAKRPLQAVIAIVLIAWVCFTFFTINSRLKYINERLNLSQKQMSLAIKQNNRPYIEYILEDLFHEINAKSVALCDAGKTLVSLNTNNNFCNKIPTNAYFTAISGFEKIQIVTIKKWNSEILQISFVLFFSFTIFIAIYYILIKMETNLIEQIKKPIETILVSDAEPAIDEIKNLKHQIVNYVNSKVFFAKIESQNEISKQVAHDIRSPLGTLNMLVSEKIDIPSEYKDLMKNVTLRINSIADDLLTKSKALGQSEISTVVDLQKGQSTLASSVNVFDAISEVITEKRILFPDFVFEIRNSATLFDITCDASELKRLMSNLINNAVEASVENKTVYISLLNQQNSLNVTIIDFGTGISEENITKIGLKQFTTKGSNGNGIGLHHAFHKMQEWGGKLSVQSKVGVGTQVELSWPLQS